MNKKFIGIILILCAFAVSACNTVRGIGQDIQRGGEAIEDASD